MDYELRHVGKQFGGTVALSDITLDIANGARVALIGPSGSGKTTLLSLLSGAQTPSSGTVTALGQSFSALTGKPRRRLQMRIGTMHQQLHLVGNLSAIHNINAGRLGTWSLARAVYSLIVPQERANNEHLLGQLGIADKLDQRTDSLSGGEQQRVALARLLAQNPDVILADEPVSSLDPERGREILDLLRDLCTRLHKTLVVSLHTLDHVTTHFDRVIGLRGGRLQFDLAAADLDRARLAELYQLR